MRAPGLSRAVFPSIACLIVLALACGCDDGNGSSADAALDVPDTGTEPDSPDGDARDADASGWGFDELIAEYGALDTIAGRGEIQTDGVDGWQPSFEGGPATDAELSRPHIALANSRGEVFIADKWGHAIRRVDLDGSIHTVAGTGEPGDDGDAPGPANERRLSAPNGLWIGSDDTLYILDLGNEKVRRVTTDGTMSTLFAIGDAGEGRGLWVDDEATEAYVSAGSVLKHWRADTGLEAFATGFESLGNLVVETDGSVIVADRGGHMVYRVDDDGVAPVAGNGTTTGGGDGSPAQATGLDEVRGVWLHPRGGFFVATHKGGDIWFVDPSGFIHLFLEGDASDTHAGDGEHFLTPGPKISEPRAVTMTPAGDILITENDHGYVRRIEKLD